MPVKKKKKPSSVSKGEEKSRSTYLTKVNLKFKFYNNKDLTQAKREELAEDIIAWADNGKPKYFFNEFLVENGILYPAFQYHCKSSEKVKEAHDYALQVMSYYRTKKAYQVAYWATFRHTQGLYDPQWKAQEQYFNDLRSAVAAKSGVSISEVLKAHVTEILKKQNYTTEKEPNNDG